MPVAFEELHAPEFSFTRGNGTAVRSFRVKTYSDWPTFLTQVFPEFFLGEPQGSEIFPQAGFPHLVTEKVDIKPFGDKDLVDANIPPNCPNGALVIVSYKTKPYKQSGETNEKNKNSPTDSGSEGPTGEENFLSFQIAIGGQMLSHSSQALRWKSDSKRAHEDVGAGVLDATEDISITWHQCMQPPWQAIRRCRSRLNNTRYLGMPAGCMLFLGVEGNRDVMVDGSRPWTFTYKFCAKNNGTDGSPKGWNFFLRPDKNPAAFEELELLGGEPIYKSESFANLFTVGGA